MKLKPCPFCDGKVILDRHDDFTGLAPEIYCRDKTCRTRMSCKLDSDIPELIERWNRRPK